MTKNEAKDFFIRAVRIRADLQVLQAECNLQPGPSMAHLLYPVERPLNEFIQQTFRAHLEAPAA